MQVLQERQLKLSRKKTRIGCLEQGFHFLGIDYPGTQPLDGANVTQVSSDSIVDQCVRNSPHIECGGDRYIDGYTVAA